MISMREKHNPCISSRLGLVAALLILCAHGIRAQYTYEEVTHTNLWNSGRNINGIRTASLYSDFGKSVSYAKLSGQYTEGDYRQSYEASSFFREGIEAASIMRLERISLIGSFSFAQTDGKKQCGSMFIAPDYYPIDVIEFTPGKKRMQEYAFEGGLSADMGQHWKIGAGINFRSVNYSKRKDLRHTNYGLDLRLTPSVLYSIGDWNLGASYIYEKNSEYVKAEQVGSSATTYYAFLDKGLYYGTNQVWNGSGTHLAESGVDRLPVKETGNGAALQVGWKSFFAEAEYVRYAGEVGEKGYTWFKFPTDRVAARVGYTLHHSRSDHIFALSYTWSSQQNKEATMDKVSSGGITRPVIYGYNEIYRRKNMSVSALYDWYLGRKLHFSASAGFAADRRFSTLVYPSTDELRLNKVNLGVGVSVNAGRFELGLDLWAQVGFDADEGYDVTFAPEFTDNWAYRQSDYYQLWHDYEDSCSYSAKVDVKWFIGRRGKPKSFYLGAWGLDLRSDDYEYDKALLAPDAISLKKYRMTVGIEIGYRF